MIEPMDYQYTNENNDNQYKYSFSLIFSHEIVNFITGAVHSKHLNGLDYICSQFNCNFVDVLLRRRQVASLSIWKLFSSLTLNIPVCSVFTNNQQMHSILLGTTLHSSYMLRRTRVSTRQS
jgi:hypothetical protein